MDWLVNPQLESNDQLEDGDGEISADQATAQSLKCDDCGKLFRNSGAAETHAYKSQHVNFSESTTAIKPLTAEEKAQKVKELQELLKIKRAERELREKEEAKTKEKVRRKTGKEMSEIKEKMQMLEHEKAMKQKAREKAEEKAAKERIKALLEADKLERQRQVYFCDFNIRQRKGNRIIHKCHRPLLHQNQLPQLFRPLDILKLGSRSGFQKALH
jgi:hypothetical protein